MQRCKRKNGRKPGLYNRLVPTEALTELKRDSRHHHKAFGGAAAVRSENILVSVSRRPVVLRGPAVIQDNL